MSTNQTINDPSRGNGKWIVALVILCMGFMGYVSFFAGWTEFDPGFLAGYYLVYALFAWGIFRAIFLRKRGTKINAFAFMCIFGSLFLGALMSASHQKQEALKALSSMQQEMQRVRNASVDSTESPIRIERSPSTSPQASGEFGEIERFVEEYVDSLVAERNDYALEMEAIGWKSILDAQRIKNDATLSESKVRIKLAKEIVAKYEKKSSDLIQTSRARIGNLSLSETMSKGMRAAFERGTNKGRSQMDELWSLEKQAVLQYENIILLLATSKGWIVQGNQILFPNTNDLAKFNAYIGKLQHVTQQEKEIQERSFTEMNRGLEAAKDAVAK